MISVVITGIIRKIMSCSLKGIKDFCKSKHYLVKTNLERLKGIEIKLQKEWKEHF